MRWLRRIFRPRWRRAVVRLVLERGPEWTDADRANLAAFLGRTATGAKLERLLQWDVCSRAVGHGLRNDFEQGLACGRAQLVGELLTLAQTDDAGGSADNPQ